MIVISGSGPSLLVVNPSASYHQKSSTIYAQSRAKPINDGKDKCHQEPHGRRLITMFPSSSSNKSNKNHGGGVRPSIHHHLGNSFVNNNHRKIRDEYLVIASTVLYLGNLTSLRYVWHSARYLTGRVLRWLESSISWISSVNLGMSTGGPFVY